jgi:hypothetical protein
MLNLGLYITAAKVQNNSKNMHVIRNLFVSLQHKRQITYEERCIFMSVFGVARDAGMCSTGDEASLEGEARGVFW